MGMPAGTLDTPDFNLMEYRMFIFVADEIPDISAIPVESLPCTTIRTLIRIPFPVLCKMPEYLIFIQMFYFTKKLA